MYNFLQKYFSSFVFLIKILIVAGAYYIISEKLFTEVNFKDSLWNGQVASRGGKGIFLASLMFLFTLANWTLEILKWRSMVDSVKYISLMEAARQSLASLTASLITPNRIGEYGAKALYFDKIHRHKVMVLNFLANAGQMLVTTFFGLLAIFFLNDLLPFDAIPKKWITGTLILLLSITFVAMLFKRLWLNPLRKVIDSIMMIRPITHQKNMSYAIGRYLVFSHQFYLFLVFFGAEIDYSLAMPVIASMYLIASVVPGFVLFDWLVKGSVAVTLFSFFGVDEMIVLSITTLMWLLNFALPAMIGSFYVLTFDGNSLILKESKVTK